MRSLTGWLAGLFEARSPVVLVALLGLLQAACPATDTVEIESSTPANGATFVPVDIRIRITFSKEMDWASLTESSIRLAPSGSGDFVAGTPVHIYHIPRDVTFTPSAPLQGDTLYVVSIRLKGAKGETLLRPGFTFRTAPSTGDSSNAPRVVATRPTDFATGVPLDTEVTVVFSEVMSHDSMFPGHVALVRTWSDPAIWDVAGTVTYDTGDNRLTFTPTALLQPNTDYQLRLRDMFSDADHASLTPNAGPGLWISVFRTVPSTGAPAVLETRPADGGVLSAGGTLRVRFDKAMDPATITPSTLRVTRKDTGAPVAGRAIYEPGTDSAVFSFADRALDCGVPYSAVLDGAKDPQGNPLTPNGALPGYRFSFTTDLACIQVTPRPGYAATAVPLGTRVAASFGEAMDPATVNASTFKLFWHAAHAPVAGEVSYDAVERVATFTPAAPLDGGTRYDLVLSGMQGPTGHLLRTAEPDGAYRSYFTTGDPSWLIESTTPADRSLDVRVDTPISIVFSRPMDPATVNAANVQVSSASDVPGAVAYDAAIRTAIFTPSAPLDPLANHQVTMSNLKAADGTSQGVANPFSFVTERAPEVLWTSPWDGAPGVPVDGTVAVTFTRPMDPATVTGSGFSVTAQGAAVPGAVAYDPVGYVATFTPAAPLAAAASCAVRLSGLRGLHGPPLVGNQADGTYRFGFQTGAASCAGAQVLCPGACVDVATDPANCGGCGIACGAGSSCRSGTCVPHLLVVATTPTSGAVNVPWGDVTVMATFDHPLDCATVTPATFHVAAGGVDAAGGLQCGGTNNTTVRFMAGPMPLQPATTYTARLETQITSAGGLVLQAPYSWTFTTSP